MISFRGLVLVTRLGLDWSGVLTYCFFPLWLPDWCIDFDVAIIGNLFVILDELLKISELSYYLREESGIVLKLCLYSKYLLNS